MSETREQQQNDLDKTENGQPQEPGLQQEGLSPLICPACRCTRWVALKSHRAVLARRGFLGIGRRDATPARLTMRCACCSLDLTCPWGDVTAHPSGYEVTPGAQ